MDMRDSNLTLAARNQDIPPHELHANSPPHAPARSRTWIYRLGGGRLIHWTTRAQLEGYLRQGLALEPCLTGTPEHDMPDSYRSGRSG